MRLTSLEVSIEIGLSLVKVIAFLVEVLTILSNAEIKLGDLIL